MVILRGGLFLMSEVPLYKACSLSASKRRGNNLKGLMNFYLKAKANCFFDCLACAMFALRRHGERDSRVSGRACAFSPSILVFTQHAT